jgi:2'-5' RNA ligase
MTAQEPQSADRNPGATLRLFFALWPDEPVRQALSGWAQACREGSQGRLVRRENLHATLAFLGEVDRSRLPQLRSLAHALAAGRFELVLERIGYWPHNRIVYAAPAAMPVPLSALAAALALRLSRAGFRTEERPYFAHVTLLRAARRAPPGVRPAPLRWPVDSIALVESRRDAGDLVYRPLEHWTLTD